MKQKIEIGRASALGLATLLLIGGLLLTWSGASGLLGWG